MQRLRHSFPHWLLSHWMSVGGARLGQRAKSMWHFLNEVRAFVLKYPGIKLKVTRHLCLLLTMILSPWVLDRALSHLTPLASMVPAVKMHS